MACIRPCVGFQPNSHALLMYSMPEPYLARLGLLRAPQTPPSVRKRTIPTERPPLVDEI
jgi:hypothetical protein